MIALLKDSFAREATRMREALITPGFIDATYKILVTDRELQLITQLEAYSNKWVYPGDRYYVEVEDPDKPVTLPKHLLTVKLTSPRILPLRGAEHTPILRQEHPLWASTVEGMRDAYKFENDGRKAAEELHGAISKCKTLSAVQAIWPTAAEYLPPYVKEAFNNADKAYIEALEKYKNGVKNSTPTADKIDNKESTLSDLTKVSLSKLRFLKKADK